MQRAVIVSGVLGLGIVLVFGAAVLASALFPNGGRVAGGWSNVGGFGRNIAVPAPMPVPMPNVGIDDGKDLIEVPAVGGDQ